MSRRLLSLLALAVALLAAACGTGDAPTQDRPNTEATLLLDFTPNAVHAGIYSTVARGFDSAEGVRLRVRVPGSSSDGIKLLLSGRAQLAVLDIHDVALAHAEGRELVCVMGIVQRPLAAVLAAPDVRDPRALAGRTVGVTGLPSDDAVLDSIVRDAGGDPAAVERVTIGFTAVPAVLGGRVDGATAFWNVEGVALRAERPGVREFRVDDYGAPPYPELVLCTTRRQLDDDPATIRAAVRALRRGYELTVSDPNGSLSDLQARVSGLDRDQLEAQLDAVLPALAPPGGKVGQLDLDVLRRWARWEKRFGIVARRPDVDAIFDARWVPTGG